MTLKTPSDLAVVGAFQYRKRYEVTCDLEACPASIGRRSFNTASGMRSHVTRDEVDETMGVLLFQYRKRYEVTCDAFLWQQGRGCRSVSIPQAV